MAKRGNEFGQVSREEFESAVENEEENDPYDQQQQQRASEEVMKQRRIVKASGKWKALTVHHESNATATTTPQNPFSFTNLTTTASNTTTTKTPAAINPFSSVVLATSTAPSRNSHTSYATHTTTFINDRTKLLLAFSLKLQQEVKANPCSNYTNWMKDIVNQIKNMDDKNMVEEKNNLKKKTDDDVVPVKLLKPPMATSVTSTFSSVPSTFSFAPPPPASTSISTTSMAAPVGTKDTSHNPTFTTVLQPVPRLQQDHDQNKDHGEDNHDDDDDHPPMEQPEEVLAAVNEDDEDLGSFDSIKFTKFDKQENKYTPWISGKLRLYRTKANQKCKLVVRNKEVGKVMLNLEVYKGMTFVQQEVPKKPQIQQVSFMAVKDVDVGLEKFTIRIDAKEMDSLVQILKDMAK